VIGGTSQRLQIGNIAVHEPFHWIFKRLALRCWCHQTHRRPFIITDAVPQFLFGGLFVRAVQRNIPRFGVTI
jgi:hypothetical protein